jgi:hypothetical protein
MTRAYNHLNINKRSETCLTLWWFRLLDLIYLVYGSTNTPSSTYVYHLRWPLVKKLCSQVRATRTMKSAKLHSEQLRHVLISLAISSLLV